MTVRGATQIAEKEISDVFALANSVASTGFAGDIIGVCPMCGNEVVRTRRGYGCKGYKEGCKFTIWSTVSGRNISVLEAKALLSDGRTELLDGFTSKKGTQFSAYLKLEDGKVVFEFDNTKTRVVQYRTIEETHSQGKPIDGIPIDYRFQ